MPHPESRGYLYSPADKVLGPERLREAFPNWGKRAITGEEMERIRACADFTGVLIKNAGSGKWYLMTPKGVKEDEVEEKILAEVTVPPRIDTLLYREERLKYEVRGALDSIEDKTRMSPTTAIFWG